MMKKTFLIAGLAAATLALTACGGKKPAASASAPAASVAASAAGSVMNNVVGKLPKSIQLELKFEPEKANAKYIGKTLKVGGQVRGLDAKAGTVQMQGLGTDMITLAMAKDKVAELGSVKEGDMVELTCDCTGTEGPNKLPIFKNCAVAK